VKTTEELEKKDDAEHFKLKEWHNLFIIYIFGRERPKDGAQLETRRGDNT
jgi:hypothetical protein